MQNKFKKAFTLIELLIVIAIIAILTVAFLPGALKAPAKARDAQRVKAVNDVAAVLESYAAEHNGTLPANNAIADFCLTVVDTKDTGIMASYFPNKKFPSDPKSTGLGACNTLGQESAYFYRKIDSNYIVGAIMEVQASGNTSATYDGTVNLSSGNFDAIKGATASSGGGTATTTVTPNAVTPYYIKVGP